MKYTHSNRSRLLINAARIGDVGGLRSFTEGLIRCIEDYPGVSVVVPSGVTLRVNIKQEEVPSWLASSTRVSPLRPILWGLYSLIDLRTMRAERILASTHHVLPLHKQQIVTVHDVRPYYYPDNRVQAFYWRTFLPKALKKCNGILTVSETSKGLLSKVYGIDPERIHVVPNVVDITYFFPAQRTASTCKPYLLTVGSSWKHKNIAELLEMHRYWIPKYQLKIVAGKGQYSELLRQLAMKLRITDHVQFLSGVPLDELRTLYQKCEALVFPSLIEGFGLPPLEAMACGRPVIVSDTQLSHELYGDIPLFVRLRSAESWCAAFDALPYYSQERIDRGISVAQSYSPQRMRYALQVALAKIWGIGIQEKSAISHS
jgi:glycosyltransferase involved in cell wall biosynthesis